MAQPWWRPYIAQRSRQLGLDPRAVLAVASQEGLGASRPGDYGTSFGPFQLHVGGALPAGRGQAWAESRQGIDYALGRIAAVARGQTGDRAIQSIVSRFERPANPAREIAGAKAAYGGASAGAFAAAPLAQGPAAPALSSSSLPAARSDVLSQLIATSGERNPDYSKLFASLAALREARTASAAPPSAPLAGGASQPGPAPARGGPALSYLLPFAKHYGLTVTSTTGGKHVEGSYHYQGRAVDYGGNAAHMAALYAYAINHPRQFAEAFYTGPGALPYFVKNGRVLPIAQLDENLRAGHTNHVHLAR